MKMLMKNGLEINQDLHAMDYLIKDSIILIKEIQKANWKYVHGFPTGTPKVGFRKLICESDDGIQTGTQYLLSLITLLAVAIATLIWDHINLTFDYQNQVYGEYAKQNYNPQNDTIRYIFFISIPLITFFVIYLNFYKKNLFTINQVLTAKVTHQSGLEENK